jgi:hypothetical protein
VKRKDIDFLERVMGDGDVDPLGLLREEITGYTREVCETCDSPFYMVRGYEKKCLICFKTDRGYNLLAGDKQFFALQDELVDAYEVIEDLEIQAKKMKASLRKTRKEVRALREEAAFVPAAVLDGLDAKMIKKMLLLCHPDHNNDSDKSKEVTAFLIQLKEQI